MPHEPAQHSRAPLWYQSLHARILAIQVMSLVIVVVATVAILMYVERAMLMRQAIRMTEQVGNRIVAEIGQQTGKARSLATSIAHIGESLPPDVLLYESVVPHVLDVVQNRAFIAGGGLWSEPFAFGDHAERRAFFWRRDSGGALACFDQYNESNVPGYHREEWYVPARHLGRDEVYWSRRHRDRFSDEPMVTCTVPMYRDELFTGVATVDVRLDGLRTLLDSASQTLGGYIFALDRNNTFLSHPNPALVSRSDGGSVRHVYYTDIATVAQGVEQYTRISEFVTEFDARFTNEAFVPTVEANVIAGQIASDSDDIRTAEARRIASYLVSAEMGSRTGATAVGNVTLEDDPVLGEEAMACIFHMPETGWKIVAVVPTSLVNAPAMAVTRQIAALIITLEIGALLLLFFVVRRLMIRRLSTMASSVRALGADEAGRLDDSSRDEIGQLAWEFNRRSDQLADARHEIEFSNRRLSVQIAEKESAEVELQRSQELLQAIIDNASSLITVKDLDGRIILINKAVTNFYCLEHGDPLGRSLDELLPHETASVLMENDRRVLASGRLAEFEETVTYRGASRSFISARFPLPDAAGRPAAICAVSTDITERKRSEQRSKLMMNELDHRVKNNLTAVIALCQLTARDATCVPQFLETFTSRVHAMARTHAALTRSRWSGISIDSIARIALEGILIGRAGRIDLSGPTYSLRPELASPVGMALFELATNAHKHGALTSEHGAINVRWSCEANRARIEWEERDGPPILAPPLPGTGTSLIRGFVEHELRGALEMDFSRRGLTCRIQFPLTSASPRVRDRAAHAVAATA